MRLFCAVGRGADCGVLDGGVRERRIVPGTIWANADDYHTTGERGDPAGQFGDGVGVGDGNRTAELSVEFKRQRDFGGELGDADHGGVVVERFGGQVLRHGIERVWLGDERHRNHHDRTAFAGATGSAPQACAAGIELAGLADHERVGDDSGRFEFDTGI